MLGLSLMTYNHKLFDILIKNNVMDILLENCKENNNSDLDLKLYSTQALVHFALNPKSIDMLIDHGVMNLFANFGIELEKSIPKDQKEKYL